MVKSFISLAVLLFSAYIQAKQVSSFYQVDLIIFTYQQGKPLPLELSLSSTLSPAKAVPLQTETHKDLIPYHLLPSSSSKLREAYWALHRKPQYRVLVHYSWLQPLNNQRVIDLPKINHEGWQVEGHLRIHRTNYYLLEGELLFSNSDSNQPPFVFAQKQRLKGGEIYYFDHPQVGMLIKIHQLG